MQKIEIRVSTHVARDFLQNAAYFNTLPKVVWEYVSNSLDNAREGQPINVVVDILGSIRIADDAMGMSRRDLQNFFQMHAENLQRLRGKRVRGRFGTGKCAAFGIANCLKIDTSQGGKRNIIELRRSDILSARSGKPFPVRDVMADEPTDLSDGTLVEISDLNIKNLDLQSTVAYIERHLSRYRQRAKVVINGQECLFEEPQASEKFYFSPPTDVAKHIGEVTLVVKVSPVPLEPETNGVDILSNGIWHDTTLAGLEKRELSQYLFGEVDVPILEDREWEIPPFDNTRNNALNIQNPVVAVLFGWIAQELESVRQKLVEAERNKKQSEEAKRLEREASEIAKILNDDFNKLQAEFEFARLISTRQATTRRSETTGTEGEPVPGGGNQPTKWQESGGSTGGKGKLKASRGSTKGVNTGPDLIPGAEPGAPKIAANGTDKRRKGLFRIEYKNETAERNRSRYDRLARTIIINMDHPQIAGAYNASGKNTESRQFREISYEVAAVEYAQAIPFEKIEQLGDLYQASEALLDVGITINRLTRRFAEIFAKPNRKMVESD